MRMQSRKHPRKRILCLALALTLSASMAGSLSPAFGADDPSAFAEAGEPTTVSGSIWYDTNMNGEREGGEVLVTDRAVTVSLYAGAYNASATPLDTVTTSTGTYEFTGTTTEGANYDLWAMDTESNDPTYTIVFTNPNSATLQFTQSTAFGKFAGTTYSHVMNVSSANTTGATEKLGLYADAQFNVVNAGITTIPTVTYLPGDDEASRVTDDMPHPLSQPAVSGRAYYVDGSVPQRPGYAFANWKVTEGLALGDTYAGGNSFQMPYNDVVLEAQWTPTDIIGLEIIGYTGVYDGTEHGISIIGAENLQIGDQIEFEADNASPTIRRSGTVVHVAGGDVMVSYNGNTLSLQSFLGAFSDVLIENGKVAAYEVDLSITRANLNPFLSGIEVKINPVEVEITTDSAAKVYDAAPLTAGGTVKVKNGTMAGTTTPIGYWSASSSNAKTSVTLVDGGQGDESIKTGDFWTTGTVTDAGSPATENGCGYDLDADPYALNKPTNYRVAERTLGMLEVTPAQLYVVTDSATKHYDGTPLTAGGTIYLGQAAFDAKTGGVSFAHDSATRQITLPNGESMDMWTEGIITDIGSITNTRSYDFNGSADATNYVIPSADELGTLEVTAGPTDPTGPTDPAGQTDPAGPKTDANPTDPVSPSNPVKKLALTGDGLVFNLIPCLMALGAAGLAASHMLRRYRHKHTR